jgi:hypothetical protein
MTQSSIDVNRSEQFALIRELGAAVASIHRAAEKASLLGNSALGRRTSEGKEGDVVLLLPALPCEGVKLL